jgi:RimJ/RimL family protein N-acetyltransferase
MRAIRAYEKAGFRIEGRLRDAILRDGRYFDEVQMGILATEWLEQRYGPLGTAEEAVPR